MPRPRTISKIRRLALVAVCSLPPDVVHWIAAIDMPMTARMPTPIDTMFTTRLRTLKIESPASPSQLIRIVDTPPHSAAKTVGDRLKDMARKRRAE